MYRWQSQLLTAVLLIIVNVRSEWIACPELSPVLRLPCKCRVEQIAVNGQSTSIGMDCDFFTIDSPQIPKGAPISTFSQRYIGNNQKIIQVSMKI